MQVAYRTTSGSASTWPEPFEGTYQSQRRSGETVPGARRPDIAWPMRLLIGSAVSLGEDRPHGMITWLAEVVRTSRPTIYNIGAQVERHREGAPAVGLAARSLSRAQVAGAALGWLSDLIDEAGERAGAVLAAADWSGSPTMVVARDELYDGRWAFLLMVDTRSLAIVGGEVVEVVDTVDGADWAVTLADGATRTDDRIEGLVEDEAPHFPPSVEGARLLLDAAWGPPVQKDHWHLLRNAGQALDQLERSALAALQAAEAKATQHASGFVHIRDFDGWRPAHDKAARAIERAQVMHTALSLLGPALAPVDARTDTLLDRETAAWYLEAIVADLRELDLTPATELATKIARQHTQLLTYHDVLARDLRAWRLERAVTNGRRSQRAAAERARGQLDGLCQEDPTAVDLAAALVALLDHAVRAQCWLNLLILWHNLRVFERGKRAGLSPNQIAGVQVHNPAGEPTTDWLDALGYAAAA